MKIFAFSICFMLLVINICLLFSLFKKPDFYDLKLPKIAQSTGVAQPFLVGYKHKSFVTNANSVSTITIELDDQLDFYRLASAIDKNTIHFIIKDAITYKVISINASTKTLVLESIEPILNFQNNSYGHLFLLGFN